MQSHPHHLNDEDVLNEAVINAAQLLALKQADISRIIGPKRTQVSDLFRKHKNAIHQTDTVYWDHAVLFLRAFRSLYTLLGEDKAQCQEWFKSYNHHLGGIPLELTKQTEGLVRVVSYLDAIRGLA